MRRCSRTKTVAYLILPVLALVAAAVLPAPFSGRGPERAEAAGPTALPCRERFGVNAAHLKIKDPSIIERELESMSEAGIRWVRFDFDWIFVEPEEGTWDLSMYDYAVDLARTLDIDILGIMGTSPTWANGGNNWNYPPTDRQAWRGYVRRLASRYRGEVAAWEIWNEENIHAFWQPEPDAAAYVELLSEASEEIREADPGAKVVMGGVAGLGPDYLDACLQAGAAEHVDALAYHPYPETLFAFDYTPQEARCRYIVDWIHGWLLPQHGAEDLELWITEVGWTTSTLSPPGVTEERQADFMLRTFVNYAGMEGVDRIFYYDMWDEAAWAFDPMSNYGLLRNDFTPRRSYRYLKTVESVLGGAVPAAGGLFELECGSPGTLEAHPFQLADGRLALAVWKTDAAADHLDLTLLDQAASEAYVVDLQSGELSAVPGLASDGEGRLTAGGLALCQTPLLMLFERSLPPSLDSVTPSRGTNDAAIDLELSGSYLGEVEEVSLFSPGSAEIPAGDLRILSGERISCQVDLEGAQPGAWEVRVSGPDGETTSLPDGFTVLEAEGSEPQPPEPPPEPGPPADPATAWYLAEGCTLGGFETWVLVQNPNDAPAEVRLTFMTPEGPVEGPARTLAANSRFSWNAGEFVGSYAVSTRVDSDLPVVAERAVYWDGRAEGHDSCGYHPGS